MRKNRGEPPASLWIHLNLAVQDLINEKGANEDIGTMYEDTFTFCGILYFGSFQCREFYKIDFAS